MTQLWLKTQYVRRVEKHKNHLLTLKSDISLLNRDNGVKVILEADESKWREVKQTDAMILHGRIQEASSNQQPSERELELTCTCNKRSRILKVTPGVFPECELCPDNKVPTADKRGCILCPGSIEHTNVTSTCKACSGNHISVYKAENGSLSASLRCLNCTEGTVPSHDREHCIPCPLITSEGWIGNCSCPLHTHDTLDGVCVPRVGLSEWPDERATYLLHYPSGEKIDSYFFRLYLRSSLYLCKQKNETACQAVANMCVMVMYQDDYRASPCRVFHDLKHIPTSSEGSPMPWLYYGDGEASTVLARRKINFQYSLDPNSKNSILNLTATRFSARGHFLDLTSTSGSFLQLCPESWLGKDKGLRFGSRYTHSCSLPARQLMSLAETEFLDLYLQYWDGSDSMMYALPVLTLNSPGNKGSDESQWQLTRRLFLIDKVSGVRADVERQRSIEPSIVRYLKSLEIRVKVQGPKEEGRIYPPLLVVEYGELTQEDIQANVPVALHFSVDYNMDNNLYHAIEVSVGVLSALAVVWSGIETWSYSRRSGKIGIDLLSLGQLALFSCGNLANVFFLVVACASIHVLFFYKGQSVVHVLLPSAAQETLIKNYVIAAFSLKIVEVVYMIWHQVSVEIFLIDWERPRAKSSIAHPQSHKIDQNSVDQPVSIWRTYFVANEWNEIQTNRKISLLFQIILTVFLLKIVGLEYWSIPDPELHTSLPPHMQQSRLSPTCRFAVGVIVYMTVYLFQWLLMVGIYERYIKNGIQDFVDVCSLANISVFILSLENYGFYIHGRSPHGFADTDMQTMIGQLQREEDSMCGHRGLLPGTDQQTFQIIVPPQLRTYYRRVMSPISSIVQTTNRLSMGTASGLRSKMAVENVDKSVQAYHSMNRFLSAFLEHVS
uniref:Meckelin n=1 Tax=Timema cristinae TaxID=61476 RepID=A0A7R9GQR9_TIMCR|nr:unnamed protein product [Timema cristinae]